MIIYRKKINKNDNIIYEYYDKNNNRITDKKILEYIDSLVIPPAYNETKIFYEKNPKIVHESLDKAGRLQQIYSKKWREKADKEKFRLLIDFGYKMPRMILDMTKHIRTRIRSKEKIISVILRIVSLCGFRVGSVKYKELYGSIGLITLDPNHIKFKVVKGATECHIKFTGKKGVMNQCILRDPLVVTELQNLSGGISKKDYIFQYYDPETKTYRHITAIDINDWLKAYNPEFTSKFFRTFEVNTKFIELMHGTDPMKLTQPQRKKLVTGIIKDLACEINNTATVCRNAYLNPQLLQTYIEHPKKYNDNMIKGNGNAHIKFIKFLEKLY
jgi:DNA topoisomerase-1